MLDIEQHCRRTVLRISPYLERCGNHRIRTREAKLHVLSLPVQIGRRFQRLPEPRYHLCAKTICRASSTTDLQGVEVDLDGIAVEEERLPKSKVVLTVTVPAALCSQAWQKALRSASKGLSLPGFRPGKKVPESTIVQYLGKEKVTQEAVSKLISSTIPQVTKKYSANVYGESLELQRDGDMTSTFDKDKDYTYKLSFEVEPNFSWKSDYRDIKVEVEAAADDAMIEKLVESRIKKAVKDQKGSLKVVVGRGLQKGDVALLDFEARLLESGKSFEGSKKSGLQFDTEDADDLEGIPGIVEGMLGMAVGDSRSIEGIVPDSWWEAELRGKGMACDITVNELFEWEVPELTDDVAEALLPGCATVEGLRRQLTEAETILTNKQTAANANEALAKAIADIADVDIPESLIYDIGTKEYSATLLEKQAAGEIDQSQLATYASESLLNQYIGLRRDELTTMQKAVFAFEKIFEEQNLTITEQEVKEEMERNMKQSQGEEIDEEKLLEQVVEVLKATKILNWLSDNVDITIIPPGR